MNGDVEIAVFVSEQCRELAGTRGADPPPQKNVIQNYVFNTMPTNLAGISEWAHVLPPPTSFEMAFSTAYRFMFTHTGSLTVRLSMLMGTAPTIYTRAQKRKELKIFDQRNICVPKYETNNALGIKYV